MSDSVRTHRWQPTRLLCPWDSSGKILEWVAIPFSRESSRPRDQTWVSRIAGRFFIVWATKEVVIREESSPCSGWKMPRLNSNANSVSTGIRSPFPFKLSPSRCSQLLTCVHARPSGEQGAQWHGAFDRRIRISFWTGLSQVNPRKSWWPKTTQKPF